MTRFDKDAYIECLSITTYNEIINALNKDATWTILANHVAKELQYPW